MLNIKSLLVGLLNKARGFSAPTKALLVIDIQWRFNWPHYIFQIHDLEQQAVAWSIQGEIESARNLGIPLIFVVYGQNDSEGQLHQTSGLECWACNDRIGMPKFLTHRHEDISVEMEPVFFKYASDAFTNLNLAPYLHKLGIKEVMLVGCYTQACVLETAKGAVMEGFDVTLLSSSSYTYPANDIDDRSAYLTHVWPTEVMGAIQSVQHVQVMSGIAIKK